jgi:hypothetical protein
MLHAEMGSVTVRVVSPRKPVAVDGLGVATSSVRSRIGARSRTKVFEVHGMSSDELAMRLRAT